MRTLRNGQRMYGSALPAIEMKLPSPEGLFNIPAASGNGNGTGSFRSSKDQENGGNYLPGHEIGLAKEKALLDYGYNSVYNKAYSLLKNEYGGDEQRFQEGEMAKFQAGEPNFYTDLTKQQNNNARYYANESLADVHRKAYDAQEAEILANGANKQVIETPDGRPIFNVNGEMRSLGMNREKQMVLRSIENPKSPDIPYSKDQVFPYVTQEDILNKALYQTGYDQNGIAEGPKYFDSYDMNENTFQTALDRIAGNAAAAMNSSEGNSVALINGLNSSLLQDATGGKYTTPEQAYLYLASQKNKTSTNLESINRASKMIYNSLSTNELRDARQELYAAQMSGKLYGSLEHPEGVSGMDLDLDTYLLNRFDAVAAPRVRTETSTITDIQSAGEGLNATVNQKATPLQALTDQNVIEAMAAGSATNMDFAEQNNDGTYTLKSGPAAITQILTPEQAITYNNASYVTYDSKNKVKFTKPATVLGGQVLLKNGSLASTQMLADADYFVMGISGKGLVTSGLERGPNGDMIQKTAKKIEINKDGKQIVTTAKEGYIHYQLASTHEGLANRKIARKGLDILIPDEGNASSKNKTYKKQHGMPYEQYQKELGGHMETIDGTEYYILDVYLPATLGHNMDGSANTASSHNAERINSVLNQVEKDKQNEAIFNSNLD